MHFTVYQTTNKIDGKIYVGKHQTANLDDGYLGSGKLLRRAIKKHGKENFKKTILHIFETEVEMNAREAEIVTEEFCARDDTYNICPGGQGGWGYVNVAIHDRESRVRAGKLGGKAFSQAHPKKVRPKGPGKGNRSSGESSPFYGAVWITNGSDNIKLLRGNEIPSGWWKGRKIKEITKLDLHQENMIKQREEHIELYSQMWKETLSLNLSLCKAAEHFGFTKQRLMRHFRELFPDEYAMRFARK